MTVRELIERLEDFDPDAEVRLAYDYGDHWNNTVAARVACVDEAEVVYSEYHGMDKLPKGRDDEDDDGEARTAVVVSAVQL